MILLLFLTLANLHAATAGDPAAGKAKSATCTACHGENGISANDQWPNLAGQKETYLRDQLTLFQQDKRQSPLMTPVAKTLSDKDVADLAAYFASMKR